MIAHKTIISTLLLSMSLSAYTINFDKEFKLALKPDTLKTMLSISTLKPSEKEVLEKLTSFSTFISHYKDVDKKGGTYSIHPQYQYENNRRYKNGYQGMMQYQISSKQADDMNTFIANLHDKKKEFDVDISIENISWVLSDSQQKGQEDILRLKAIKWITQYANELSTTLHTTCKVRKISLSSPQMSYPRPMMLEAKALSADSAPTPEQDQQVIAIHPHFELECL